MNDNTFMKDHFFIVKPKNQFNDIKKGLIKSTNNGKTITSVFILKLQNNGNDQYIRKYTKLMDNGIYCFDLTGGNDKETTITDITDIEKIKQFDNRVYGGFFE